MTSTAALPPNVRVLTELAADDAGFSVSNEAQIRALSAAEDRHFWHASRNHFIQEHLAGLGVRPPARVLELGCGGGSVAAALAHRGYEVVGVDGHRSRVCEAARRAPEASFFVHDLSRGPGSLGDGFDVVGLFDVIEHLDHPREALELGLGRLRPGGWLVGTVPALMALWSQVDVLGGHRLRYESSGLARVLAIPGARLHEIRDFNRLLVLPMWLQRKQSQDQSDASQHLASISVPPAPVNQLAGWLLRLEYRTDALWSRLRIPGASLWFALQKT